METMRTQELSYPPWVHSTVGAALAMLPTKMNLATAVPSPAQRSDPIHECTLAGISGARIDKQLSSQR